MRLAYAGGSTAAFSELARAAPEWMEVVGIEMPGKGELADARWPAPTSRRRTPKGAASEEAGRARRRRRRRWSRRRARRPGGGSPPERGRRRWSRSSVRRRLAASRCRRGLAGPGRGRPHRGEDAAKARGGSWRRSDDGRLADRIAADAAGSAIVLIGWSMGGMLAAELALMLQARGCTPQMLHVAGRMARLLHRGRRRRRQVRLASDEMKATEAWREWLLPMLMADLRADARAEQRVAAAWSDAVSSASEGGAASCTLQVCAGHEDAAFPPTRCRRGAASSGCYEATCCRGATTSSNAHRRAAPPHRARAAPIFAPYGWRGGRPAVALGGIGGGGRGEAARAHRCWATCLRSAEVATTPVQACRWPDAPTARAAPATPPLTWRTLSGNAPHPRAEAGEEEAPREFAQLRAPSPAGGLTANVHRRLGSRLG